MFTTGSVRVFFHSPYRNPIMKCKGLLQGLLADRVFEYGEFDCDVEFMP